MFTRACWGGIKSDVVINTRIKGWLIMRGVQSARQWKILRLIEGRKRGYSVKELAHELEANIRTIYRDLEALQEAGFPLYDDKTGKRSHWRMVDGFKSNLPLPFTMTELMSLHMSRDLLKVFDGTVFQESIESLFDKVKTALPPKTIRYLERIAHGVSIGFGPAKDHEKAKEIISMASEATGQRKRVQIQYIASSTGQMTSRKIDPYQVWAMNGGFYLIGFCHLRGSVRTFALERVRSLSTLNESFHYPEDFSLEDYLQTAFKVMRGNPEIVKIQFAPWVAGIIKERIWHPTQEIREQGDGSLLVTMEVPINYEIISWILGFGSAAEVKSPASLKNKILEELEESLERYRSQAAPRTKIVKEKKFLPRMS
jgi:predicted DNA-binding transcriptional regulator YafY